MGLYCRFVCDTVIQRVLFSVLHWPLLRRYKPYTMSTVVDVA